MWSIYSFKLAYAEDNSFELRVNTNWSCFEFVEKVTAVARVTFPSISVTDVMHVTESWNQIHDPNYNHIPSEENAPIPLISQTIAERYYPNPRSRHFYIYFHDECQNIQLRHLRNEPRTLEQNEVSIDYYYDIWVGELEFNNRNRDINELSYLMPTGTYNYNRETSDRSENIQSGWTGMTSQYLGGLNDSSQAVSLDNMMDQPQGGDDNEISTFQLPRNLFDDFENEVINTNSNSNDIFPPLDRNNIYNYTNQRRPFWAIPENVITNPLGFNVIEPEYTPIETTTNDCCICFSEATQCFTLTHCNHSVCAPCYTGIYTRVNGDVDLRCPMCRIPNSFNNNIYRQIVGIDI
jgi:hypothetical protein